ALAKQLNRIINLADDQHQKKIEQLQAPIVEQVTPSVLAATGFALKHRQGFALTSASIQF
ncbi:MAG TPA: hypothetical protein VIC51_01215, partial [Psychromonas sp.]